MRTSRGVSVFPLSLVLAATAGLALGLGAFAFDYAKGSSYLGNDPRTCANCHVMEGHYAGWLAGTHHAVATCNDCHTPAAFLPKYWVKATNGYHHSMAFTMGGYPDAIKARPESAKVVEDNCRRCHAAVVEDIAHGGDVSCVRCHRNVGHLR
ncbi:cytochrome c nitrate reductase, small subunit [Anaeromyxobacter sp. K]|uniref:cytochrome c nitrite reductase small subunit n=1 Tax=Anaeromyxobacter sp. (strain K) TaxID=447217 RepID=UPI00017BE30D|nr:cytochrome c nitrite reductase small subunit [Anaeromyxobacter sp. K]ACG74210.1 cytochrome c nitrate reductase, small subunit [Anaeromyxobacter sp. K]